MAGVAGTESRDYTEGRYPYPAMLKSIKLLLNVM